MFFLNQVYIFLQFKPFILIKKIQRYHLPLKPCNVFKKKFPGYFKKNWTDYLNCLRNLAYVH